MVLLKSNWEIKKEKPIGNIKIPGLMIVSGLTKFALLGATGENIGVVPIEEADSSPGTLKWTW